MGRMSCIPVLPATGRHHPEPLWECKGPRGLWNLAKCSDVIIRNFNPGAAKLMGTAYDNLKAIKPDIIFAAITCYGNYGPYSYRVGFDPIAQTMSGAVAITSFTDNPPARS